MHDIDKNTRICLNRWNMHILFLEQTVLERGTKNSKKVYLMKLVGCFVLWRINPFEVIYCQIKFQTIQFSISIIFVYKQLNVKTVLFQAIQFSMSTQFWPIDRTQSGATPQGKSGPESDGNEGVLCIPQDSSITGTSPSDCLMSYPGHSWGGYPQQRNSQCIQQP